MYTYSEKRRQKDEAAKNAARREQIQQLKSTGITDSEISRIVGVSRQRVHQITTGYRSFAAQKSHANQHPHLINRNCADCGNAADHVHHIDGDSRNNTAKNLVKLCQKCHYARHAEVKRKLDDTWVEWFWSEYHLLHAIGSFYIPYCLTLRELSREM